MVTNMLSSFVLSQILIRTLSTCPGHSDAPPPTTIPTATPVESADPKNAPITRLESADPKTKHLKSFRIRRSEKRGGRGGKLLTRIRAKTPTPVKQFEGASL